jgi:hypothetical protein
MWLCGVLAFDAAAASEGRASALNGAAPERERVARYAGAAGKLDEPSGKTHSATTSKNTSVAREKRAPSVIQSHRESDFHIWDAGSALLTDRDEDGFYREFRIRFDADVVVGDALVYAKLYLRRDGEADWLLYHVTGDFQIEGESPDDDYFVTTLLEDGYASAEYDVLIDLYEVGVAGVVATLDPLDSAALSLLPLEEISVDAPIQIPGFEVRDITTTLLIDDDADGHYSRFRIAFDPDADVGASYLYARIWVRPQGGEWIEEHVSDDFLVDESGALDAFSITADWISGYPTAYYDVQIDLYDSATNLLAASAGSERPELALVPLEDEARDARPGPPVAGGNDGSTISRERGGGGALGAVWALAFALLLAVRSFSLWSQHHRQRRQKGGLATTHKGEVLN